MRLGRGRKVAGKLGCCWHRDFRDLLADPAVDLVILAVPTRDHVPFALPALEAGKHELVEKPLAHCEKEVRLVFARARQPGRFAGAFQNPGLIPIFSRFRPCWRRELPGLGHAWPSIRMPPSAARIGKLYVKWAAALWPIGVRMRWIGPSGSLARSFPCATPPFTTCSTLATPKMGFTRFGKPAPPALKSNISMACLCRRHDGLRQAGWGVHARRVRGSRVQVCQASRLVPPAACAEPASDGHHGISEDLGWEQRWEPWGWEDTSNSFFDALQQHLCGEAKPPVPEDDVLAPLRLMDRIQHHGRWMNLNPPHGFVRPS